MRPGHQIILINGPRKSGKDTAANYIMREWLNIRHKKFAGCMKRALREFFCIDDALWKALETTDSGPLKLEKRPEFFGMSWVDALIWFSEEVMKPKFGADIFGQLLAREMRQPTAAYLTVISDSGFTKEALVICKAFGPKNCHVFQLYRDGYTFAGDSRSYLCNDDFPAGVTWHLIHNNYEQDMYRRQILIRTAKILGSDRTYD